MFARIDCLYERQVNCYLLIFKFYLQDFKHNNTSLVLCLNYKDTEERIQYLIACSMIISALSFNQLMIPHNIQFCLAHIHKSDDSRDLNINIIIIIIYLEYTYIYYVFSFEHFVL